MRVLGLTAPVVHTDAERLPFASNAFDLVYSWGMLHHTPRMTDAVAEAYRVLKPGGEIRVMLYHRRSWVGLFTYLKFALLKGKPFRSFADVIAHHVESPGTQALIPEEAQALLAGFKVLRLETRLTPYDRLEGSRSGHLCPRFLVDALGDRFGWFMLIRAVKPVAV